MNFRAETSLKNITDGTSLTLLGGEVGRAESESGHAFNGDHNAAIWAGEESPFCQRCDLNRKEGGDGGFGSVHAGIVLFVMCDASVQAVSKEVNLAVLDRIVPKGFVPEEGDGGEEGGGSEGGGRRRRRRRRRSGGGGSAS